MSFAPNPAKCIVCLVMLLAAGVLLLPGPVLAYNGATCAAKWPQDRLAVSPNLKARHFVLEPLDEVQQLPPFLEPGARRVFHRAFSLSLDAAEPIGMFPHQRKKDLHRRARRRHCAADQGPGVLHRPGRAARAGVERGCGKDCLRRHLLAHRCGGFHGCRVPPEKGRLELPVHQAIFCLRPAGPHALRRQLPYRFGAACAVFARLGVKGRDVAAGSLGHRRAIA